MEFQVEEEVFHLADVWAADGDSFLWAAETHLYPSLLSPHSSESQPNFTAL